MKQSRSYSVFLTILAFPAIVIGQNTGRVSDLYMAGKWRATCPIEIIDHASIRICKLCAFVPTVDDASGRITDDMELTFLDDLLTLEKGGVVRTVLYNRNKDNHSFVFTLDGQEYNFRVFLYNNQRIIEDREGLLMVLDKVE